MNTLSYLQFFEGLAEKMQGSFSTERVSSKLVHPGDDGVQYTYRCWFEDNDISVVGQGQSRKEALHSLYRKLHKFS
ncbi:MAG: hypothetical protein A2508_00860 [Candidatus Lambdaproteobacteria bacterium RIFOXYD12_FULL_49_8]|uniref:DRBM domain-containing protein n=1 Tax=Candidatus Lambdaproteobacteria bacterium RIFOXYD2_FULL_50_16 TaxID=1817772 RepID=A0A1F6GFT7_9PROT|nr:MAG: hypothetical protein A2508_00860 [Candidatus Lambdaproteobacteria bacterium RIFOXYD12_FULL_49_8]OGG96974.1 MAG: hypothetical protein A2527_02650 [Candidatus Lambdaproteobacteria bacterium RIFOXYD2_FULL_50_16]